MVQFKIKCSSLKFFLIIFVFFEPWLFTRISLVDAIFNLLKLGICMVTFMGLIKKIYSWSSVGIIFLIYRVFVCVVTIYHGQLPIGYIVESIQLFFFFVIVEDYIKKKGIDCLRIILGVSCFYLVLNAILLLAGGVEVDGVVSHLFGIRTRIADIAIPMIGLAAYYYKSTTKGKILLVGIVSSALIFFINQWVATALTGLVFFAFLLMLDKFIYRRYKKTYIKTILICVIGISLGIVLFNIQELVADLLIELLNKNASLTGRTDIWKIALVEIKEQWLFGHGFINQGNFVHLYNFIANAHNQWLQTMFYGGAIGCVIFYSIPIRGIKKIIKEMKTNSNIVIMLYILAVICIMCTTEIYMDNIYFYCFMLVINNCAYLRINDNMIIEEGKNECTEI